MGNPEDQPSDDERRVAESELGSPPSDESSPLVVAPPSDEELAVVTKTLVEAAPLGAAGEVFEQNPNAVITILRNSLFQPSKTAKEVLLLPVLATALDSSSDLLSLHLRARLENPEIHNGERQEALTLLIYTALGSYHGDRLYSSYAFNHLAGAIASGEITHPRLEDEVNELARKVSYSNDQKEAFLQLVEERATAYLHDAKAVLKDLSRGNTFRRSSATEEKRLDLYTAAEEREEVLEIAKDIVSNPRMLRFARATLVKQIYLDKDTELSERHRLQERLQTLAEAGSKLMDADPTTFLAEHLISYNAGEWDLCAQLVAIRDVMGNRQVAAILRTAAGEELFQDQALKMMVEVAHHNPDSSTIAATLNAMLKSGEVDEGGLLLIAQQVLGGEEVAGRFLDRVSKLEGGVQSALPIPDLQQKDEVLYRFYENYYEEKVKSAFDILRQFNVQLPVEQEEKVTKGLAHHLWVNRSANTEINTTNSSIDKTGTIIPSRGLHIGHRLNDRFSAEIHDSNKAALKGVLSQIDAFHSLIDELSLRLPKDQAERLLACEDRILSREFNLDKDSSSLNELGKMAAFFPNKKQKELRTKLFGERDSSFWTRFDLSVAVSALPLNLVDQLIRLDSDYQGEQTMEPDLLAYATEHPLELAPFALMADNQLWATQLSRMIYPLLAEDSSDEAKEARRAIQEQLITEARNILGSENVIAPNEIQEILGVEIDAEKVPVIPFSRAELETAAKLGQFLVFRYNQNDRGEPITMKLLEEILQPRFKRDHEGDVLHQTTWCKNEDFFDKQIFDSGWALTTREYIPKTQIHGNLDMVSELASYIEIILRDITDPALRDEYSEAIEEYDQRKIEQIINSDWREATKQVSELKLNKMFRQTPVEAMYDIMMYFEHNRSSDPDRARLLRNTITQTNQLSSIGTLVTVGSFSSVGLYVNHNSPGFSDHRLGVSFSRTQ